MLNRRTTILLALLFVLAIVPGAYADGSIAWSSTSGPTGGQINALVVASNVIYAGSNGGMFVTRDEGAHWQSISKGLPEDQTITALAMGRDANELVAGTHAGIYRTRDGGATWSLSDARFADQSILSFFVDPQSAAVIYAGTTTTILKTENLGDAWSEAGKDLPTARVLGLAGDGSAVYAATEAGVFVSRDRGAHWQASSEGLPAAARPQSIVVNTRGILVGTTQGLYRSRDGKTWSAVGGGVLATGLVRPILGDPRQGDRVFAVVAQSVFKSTDGGSNWTGVKSPISNLSLLSLAFSDKNVLYAGTTRGVWRSSDEGASWLSLPEGLVSTSVHALLLTSGNSGTLFAATRFGLALSRDHGATWRDAPELKDPYVLSLAQDPSDPQVIYAGTWGSSVFVSRDGGNTFAPGIDNLANNAPITSLAILRTESGIALYAGTLGSGLFKSVEGGTKWVPQTAGLSNVSRVTALDLVAPATLYAGTERGLYRLDGSKPNASWEAVGNLPNDEVRLIAADPQNRAVMLVAFAASGLFRTENNGAQWQALGSGKFPARARFQAIAFNPSASGVIYIGTDRGVYRSEDKGATWALATDGLAVADVQAIVIDPEAPNTIYVGTNGNGVARGVDRLESAGPDLFTVGTIVGSVLSAIVLIAAFVIGWRSRFGPVAQDRTWRGEWDQWETAITQALWKSGEANASNLGKLPRRYLLRSLHRYIQVHPTDALALQISPPALKLETFPTAQKFLGHWKAAWEVIGSEETFRSVTSQMVDQLCGMFGFTRVEERSYHGLVGYVVKAPALRLKIPPRFPIIFLPRHEAESADLNELRDLMGILNMVSYFALVIDLRDVSSVEAHKSLKRIVREATHDFIVLDGTDIRTLLSARDHSRRLVDLILGQVDLTVISPYVTSGPVPENMFFGRDHELKTIVRTVRDTNFAIVGGRKIGKTSVLARVYQLLKDAPEYQPFYLDCQAVHNYEDFFNTVDTMWQLPLSAHTPEGLRVMARDLSALYATRTVVMLFDEIDDLLQYDIAQGERLFQILRALSQEGRNHFVFCGEKVLNSALHNPRLVFFNFCNLMPLSYLTPEEARRVVTDPMQDMGVALDDDRLADRIVELAAGHPNIVQYICQKLIERINLRRERLITRVDLSALSQSAQFAEYFAEVSWGEATALERLITLLMLEHPEVTLGEMAETLRARDLRISPAQLENALDDLCLFSILRRDGPKYTFAARAFPEVLRRSQDVYGLILSFTEEIQKNNEPVNVNN